MFSNAFIKLTDKETSSPIWIDHLQICCVIPEDDYTTIWTTFSQKFTVKELAPEIMKTCDDIHATWLEEETVKL